MPSLFTEASKTVLGTQKTLKEKKVNWDQERQVTPGHKAKQFVSLISQQMVQCYSRYTVTFTEYVHMISLPVSKNTYNLSPRTGL